MSEEKKTRKVQDPFSEMEKIDKYKAEKQAQEQLLLEKEREGESEIGDEADGSSAEDNLLFPLPEKTVDHRWALKMTGIVSGAAVLLVLLVFVFLLTYPIGLGVTDAEFIERYNALEFSKESLGDAYAIVVMMPQSVISGSDVIGTIDEPTETTTPGFCVSAERTGNKITSVTIEIKDAEGFDYDTGEFIDPPFYTQYYLHVWRVMAAIDPYYTSYGNIQSWFRTVNQNASIGGHIATANGRVFVFSFTDRLFIKIYPARPTIARLKTFMPPEIDELNAPRPDGISDADVSDTDISAADAEVSPADAGTPGE
ncbi:MAG: hypothetical protein FWE86_01550 [Oscillospiraceae bacterium]|nr:hypothetical protein [Oscillospiraceae bacterium]